MKRLTRYAAIAACLWLASGVAQAKVDPGVRLITAGEPVVVAQDKALAILRIQSPSSMLSAFLMRIPSSDELSAYETAKHVAYNKAGKKAGAFESFVFDYQGVPNLYELPVKKAMVRGAMVALVVAELPPGDYILYGQGFSSFLHECMCFGTVGFTLRAGQATDLGTLLIDKGSEQSSIPELTAVSGLGRIGRMDYELFAVGLRLVRPGDIAVPGLDAAKIAPAQFHAIGPFVEANATLATRLAPVAGVLRYDGGRVIDIASGREALAN
ncbi:MAG TPA: hypothetical protein VJM09_08425 [Sphingobium sp.]|nr:hypothetical protein [Sphingobium sp.]